MGNQVTPFEVFPFMDFLAPVSQVVYVEAAGAGDQELVVGGHKGVFQQDLIQLIGIQLGLFKHIHKAKPKAGAFAGE